MAGARRFVLACVLGRGSGRSCLAGAGCAAGCEAILGKSIRFTGGPWSMPPRAAASGSETASPADLNAERHVARADEDDAPELLHRLLARERSRADRGELHASGV